MNCYDPDPTVDDGQRLTEVGHRLMPGMFHNGNDPEVDAEHIE